MIEVRRATVDDLDRSAEVLGLAFADYAWTRWTVDPDDHVERITGLQRLALENLGLPFGQVWLATVDGIIESVAVWMDSAIPVPAATHRPVAEAAAALAGSRSAASLAADAQDRSVRDRRRWTRRLGHAARADPSMTRLQLPAGDQAPAGLPGSVGGSSPALRAASTRLGPLAGDRPRAVATVDVGFGLCRARASR